MASKRMFHQMITNSDDFLEMPVSSQVLYFHLSMNADDDGFINNWKSIMRLTGTKEDDLKILIAKSFVIFFEDEDKLSSGIIVIKHWRINNYLRSDRYKATKFQKEFKKLQIAPSGAYELSNSNIGIPTGIPVVDTDKNSIDKNSIDKNSISSSIEKYYNNDEKSTTFDIYSYYENNIGSLSSKQYQELSEFQNKLSDEIVLAAIDKSIDSNAKNFNYLRAILKSWVQKNYKTLGDIQNESKENKKGIDWYSEDE